MNSQQRAEEIMSEWAQVKRFAPEIAQELADAKPSILLPAPAKPAVTSIEGYHTYHPWAIWRAEGLTINCDHEGTIYIDDEAGRNISMSPEQARALIGTLLAAADYAEQERENE